MTKNLNLAAALLALACAVPAIGGAQSGYDLFQQALVKERSGGQMQQAILLYQRVVAEHTGDRALVAKALVQLGRVYETLGSGDARAAYQRVVRDFADQGSEAGIARARLAFLAQLQSSSENTGARTRRLRTGSEIGGGLNALSPDGRYVSFVDWSTGDLALLDLATGDSRRVTHKTGSATAPGFALYSVFSPDGRQLAFSWQSGDTSDIRIVNVDGSGLRTVYRNPAVSLAHVLEWSPDGSQVATLLRNPTLGLQLALISTGTGAARVLKSFAWRYPNVSFHPRGRYIAYSITSDDKAPQSDVFLIATDGSSEIPLLQHPASDWVLGWTPQGDGLLFASDRTGTNDLWLLPVGDDLRTGEARLLARDHPGTRAPLTVTRSGAFYYTVSTLVSDVYSTPFDPGSGRVMGPPAKVGSRFVGTNSGPDWSPDGRTLAFRRGVPGGSVIVLRDEKTGEERHLTMDISGLHVRGPRWSPDGRSMVIFAPDRSGRWGLLAVDVQTGGHSMVHLHASLGFAQQWQWAPDGHSVAFIRDQQIITRDTTTGHESVLQQARPAASGGGFEFSKDGQWLVFTVQDSATESMSLNLRPTAGGTPRVLVQVQKPEELYTPAWTPDGHYVLFTKRRSAYATPRGGANTELLRVDVRTGEIINLGVAMVGLNQVRVHPDGSRIAFTAASGLAELWVMEDFLPGTRFTPRK